MRRSRAARHFSPGACRKNFTLPLLLLSLAWCAEPRMFRFDWSIACAAKSRRHAYIEEEERFRSPLRNDSRGKVSLDAALLGITAVERFLIAHVKCVFSRRLICK